MEDSRTTENLIGREEIPFAVKAEDSRTIEKGKAIGVIGTGNAAIAITKRLISSGHSVIVGSRKPHVRHTTLTQLGHCLCGAELTSIAECLRRCDVIIVAIHMENFNVTLEPFSRLTCGKILVDMSNRETRYVSRSNAQYLASILPDAEVVKAFNTISASVMENNMDMTMESQKVFVACDNDTVRNNILDLSRSMGFQAMDYGNLKNSVDLEDFVLKVFPHWKIPIFLTFGIFNLWSLYLVYIYFIDKTAYKWEQIFLKVLNKSVCMTAMTSLALTYLPGQIASILQVSRGTKHSIFPRFLDTWLKSRKQFGLITFVLVCFHVIASTLMLSPTYYSSWFHKPSVVLPVNMSSSSSSSSSLTSADVTVLPISTSWMIWKGELALFFGIIAFIGMCVQAVTSIQSIANSLNWSEWKCVQSRLGTYVLILASSHVISMGAPGWVKVGPMKMFTSITFLSLILPILVLLIKFTFQCTPLRCYLAKIRRGWERHDQNSSDENKLTKQTHGSFVKTSATNRQTNSFCHEEDTVKLKMDDNDEEYNDCCDIQKEDVQCRCHGNVFIESTDRAVKKEKDCCSGVKASKGGVKAKTSVRFSSSTKCNCSGV